MDSGASWAIYSLFIVYATPYSLWGCKRVGHDLVTTATAKSLQSCPTLCHPIDSSPPGSPVLGILQARTLEWVAISFSNAWKWKVKGKSLSRVWLLATPWTAAHQVPLSMGFSRQEYWSGVPVPSPDLVTKEQQFYVYSKVVKTVTFLISQKGENMKFWNSKSYLFCFVVLRLIAELWSWILMMDH